MKRYSKGSTKHSIRHTFDVEYVCGKIISAPTWLKDCRGHDLEAAVRETFRATIGRNFVITQNDCADLVDMLSERLPEFIPTDLLKIFDDLRAA